MCEGYFTAMSEFKKSGKSTYFCKSVLKKEEDEEKEQTFLC